MIGLITDNDETAYREEVSTLTKWCQENHLSLNIDKTKELVVDYRRQSREHTTITIDKTPVERVNSFKFLSVHITEDLTWSVHTDAVLKKAHSSSYGWGSLERAPASSDHSTPALWRVEIDRYIGLPIFFPIFKHFTIIGYRFKKNKGYIYVIVTYRIIQSLTSSEMCSLSGNSVASALRFGNTLRDKSWSTHVKSIQGVIGTSERVTSRTRRL